MRYPVILPRVWLLVAVFQGASTGWRRTTRTLESVHVRGDFDDARRHSLEDGLGDVVPPTMMRLYSDQETRGTRLPNSVVRSFREQGPDSNATTRQATPEQWNRDILAKQVACVYFNLSGMPLSETTQRAELSLYIDFAGDNQTTSTLVTVYRATRPLTNCSVDDADSRPGHLRRVGQRTVAVRGRLDSGGKWITFVVSRAVVRWRRRPEKNFGFVVVWTELDRSSARFVVGRKRAYLVTYGSDTANSPADLIKTFRTLPDGSTRTVRTRSEGDRRRRRHTKRNTRSKPRRGRKYRRRGRRRKFCRRRSMYVDFGEIGWDDWIVAPPGYKAFYCAGDCPFYMPDYLNATNHAIVQSLIHSVDARLAPRPCCVPTELSPMSMLYVDNDDNVVLKNYQDMVVEACGCR